MSEINSSSRIEDLANPKDKLKKKIVALAETMRKWNNDNNKARKTVKEQFEEILDLGLNKYKMETTELRRLIEGTFSYYSVS
jgi:predicted  nucleic acid-binding Zn-ribbon protein